ncbi:MAG TPA: Orn/Lys/Arg decarboxylase N-terminal domain-containing protein, partial [Acidiphilium sp.]
MRELNDYPIAVIDDDYTADSAGARVIRALVAAFEARGHKVLAGLGVDDARAGRVLYTGLSAVLVSIDGFADRETLIEALDAIVSLALARAPDLPVFLYGERRMPDDPPVGLMERIDGYLYLHEDTPGFMAGYV